MNKSKCHIHRLDTSGYRCVDCGEIIHKIFFEKYQKEVEAEQNRITKEIEKRLKIKVKWEVPKHDT